MNSFIYEATHGSEYDNYEVCFPIRTEKTLDELCEYLHEMAIKYIRECWDQYHSYEEIFYPFEDPGLEYKRYEILVPLCSSKQIRNYLTPIEKWKGAYI